MLFCCHLKNLVNLIFGRSVVVIKNTDLFCLPISSPPVITVLSAFLILTPDIVVDRSV